MARLPDVVKKAVAKQNTFPVATCNQEGIPNVIYIKYLKVIDDEIVLDKEKDSFQIKGTAERLTEGDMFDEVQKWVPDKLPRVAAVIMRVESVYSGAERLS